MAKEPIYVTNGYRQIGNEDPLSRQIAALSLKIEKMLEFIQETVPGIRDFNDRFQKLNEDLSAIDIEKEK